MKRFGPIAVALVLLGSLAPAPRRAGASGIESYQGAAYPWSVAYETAVWQVSQVVGDQEAAYDGLELQHVTGSAAVQFVAAMQYGDDAQTCITRLVDQEQSAAQVDGYQVGGPSTSWEAILPPP